MNDLELAFWLFFEVAFALTHFNTRFGATFLTEASAFKRIGLVAFAFQILLRRMSQLFQWLRFGLSEPFLQGACCHRVV